MDRRDFLRLSGVGMGTLVIPVMGGARSLLGATGPIPTGDKKTLADAALDAARGKGATYADVRIGRYLNQFVITREDKVQNIVNTESYGAGVRVVADGTWGFAATSTVDKDSLARTAEQAVAIAKANATIQTEPVVLAPARGVGEVSWRTPIRKNSFDVPISEKVEMMMDVNALAMGNGANFINSFLFLVNEQKYFASTDGSYIDQDVHRIWPNFNVTAVDAESGKFRSRQALSAPMGMGWEYMDGDPKEKVAGVVTNYRASYDMREDARTAAQHVQQILKAKSVEPGKYDLVLDPSHLWLTIHESVGHPLELDRVL
ncbi:MAG: TldD/PmbA family protein, partial [Thermoanaerobaculia bacterium]|nr:TldD/PmbA family protein [Thermoanaerobaculia bacterium]